MLPFPSMPCTQTPPGSPAAIAFCGYLLLPSMFSTMSAPGLLTRLNSFTCVTAWMSLCLRLVHAVATHGPKTRFPVEWLCSFPGRESHPLEAPGLSWRTKVRFEINVDNCRLPAVCRPTDSLGGVLGFSLGAVPK